MSKIENGTSSNILALPTDVVIEHQFDSPILVTRPSMPPMGEYIELLEDIWESKQLTNGGPFHNKLEGLLSSFLESERVSLFCNGTLSLLVALQCLRINSGEVITTPFTFPATVHVLIWNGLKPVFSDIDPNTYCLDPESIEKHITPNTKAIMPVHVYGMPCNIDAFQDIADRHGLRLIYDAAHAFGTKWKGQPLSKFGDISSYSFHATKLFSTIEGGLLVSRDDSTKKRIDYLKNFGFSNEESVIGPGINGKMNEFQAAFGVLQFANIETEIQKRQKIFDAYTEKLNSVDGLTLPTIPKDVTYNYSYFPILVNEEQFGMSRDDVQEALKQVNVFSRKYFYPLCSHFPCYSSLESANMKNLPIAEQISKRVLCFPIYGDLSIESVHQICSFISQIANHQK